MGLPLPTKGVDAPHIGGNQPSLAGDCVSHKWLTMHALVETFVCNGQWAQINLMPCRIQPRDKNVLEPYCKRMKIWIFPHKN